MNYDELFDQIRKKRTYLCVGLDTDIKKIPRHLLRYEDPVFEFNKQIIEATAPYCIAYKPNIAFYEAMGASGWESLRKTLELIPPQIFTIADAKRGDIGNTSRLYARTFFEKEASGLDFDAVTVAPYMGSDSVKPFLDYPQKWVILLALTSNPGSYDFQHEKLESGEPLFVKTIAKSREWTDNKRMMYVVGATRADQFELIRQAAPDHFLLVPGVGAQGGDLKLISQVGMNDHCGLIVNASRSIIYASEGEDFARAAATEAAKLQTEMNALLSEKGL